MRWMIIAGAAAGYIGALGAGCHLAAGLDGVEFDGGGAPGNGGAGGAEGGNGPGGNEGGQGAVGGMTSAGGGGADGGGGAMPGDEDCTNGIDDDDDDLVDCEDDDCTPAFLCVPNAPTDWEGPVASFTGPTTPPDCPGDYDSVAYDGVSDLSFDPVTCNACSCTAPNTVCNASTLIGYEQSDCSDMLPIAYGQSCDNANSGNFDYVQAAPPTAAPGTGGCVESGGGVDQSPTPTFDVQARLCDVTAATGGGCLSDQTCMPAVGSSTYEEEHCIHRAGDHACPPPFNDKRLLFDGTPTLNDARDCTACSCPFTGGCTGATGFHSTNMCIDFMPPTLPNDGATCVLRPGGNFAQFIASNITGSCPPSGGNPTGAVSVDGGAAVTTICCLEP